LTLLVAFSPPLLALIWFGAISIWNAAPNTELGILAVSFIYPGMLTVLALTIFSITYRPRAATQRVGKEWIPLIVFLYCVEFSMLWLWSSFILIFVSPFLWDYRGADWAHEVALALLSACVAGISLLRMKLNRLTMNYLTVVSCLTVLLVALAILILIDVSSSL
jgi:hypothetical protein